MITVSMLSDLNTLIQEEMPSLRIIVERHDATGRDWTYYKIGLKQNRYINTENHPLNITEELTKDIEKFLSSKGANDINWNNNFTTFWESH